MVNTATKQGIQPGARISLPGIDWSQTDRTLVLALSTNCYFCTASAPFYQKLQQTKPESVRLLAVLPQSIEESREYLTELGVERSDILQSPLRSIGIVATPTLILVDKHGVVKQSWVGKLPDAEAAKVLAELTQSQADGGV